MPLILVVQENGSVLNVLQFSDTSFQNVLGLTFWAGSNRRADRRT